MDFPTHLAIRAVLTIECKNIFAKVPDYLEATILYVKISLPRYLTTWRQQYMTRRMLSLW